MQTIDEIFYSMPEVADDAGYEYLTIDPATRQITVPEAERIFGVVSDEVAVRKYFRCPRYVGDGLDLAGMFLTVYFRNAQGEEDGYLVQDVQAAGDFVTFSWQLWPKVTQYNGPVQFAVCADLPNTATLRRPDWNTTIAEGEVLEGMDPDLGDLETGSSDVLTQLRQTVTEQTQYVENACAVEQVKLQMAAQEATAEAQEQIAAKGAATLATIPADYTTLANKTNEQANAIKGHLAGEIVQAGDVSPVEHYLAVKARGKNLFNADKIKPTGPFTNYAYITAAGGGSVTIYSNDTDNGYCSTGLKLRDICPGIEVGRVYTLSGTTEAEGREWMYFLGTNVTVVYGRSFTATEAILDSNVVFYGINGQTHGAASCTISNIQIEEGTVATEYAPYIDPATVTVTRCGKNLTAHTAETKTDKQNGVSLTRIHNSAVFTVDGTATEMSSMVATSTIMLPPGTYTASVHGLNKIDGGTDRVYLWNQPAGKVVQNGIMDGLPKTFTLTAATPVRAELVFAAGSSYSSKIVKIQIERGAAATSFEEYAAATAMPDESGTVTGLPSLAPKMTLHTDTAGVTVECEYNRDSNAVYAELLAKIAALSGTT